MTFKANEIEQYPYLVYTDDAGNVYDPNGGGGGGGGGEVTDNSCIKVLYFAGDFEVEFVGDEPVINATNFISSIACGPTTSPKAKYIYEDSLSMGYHYGFPIGWIGAACYGGYTEDDPDTEIEFDGSEILTPYLYNYKTGEKSEFALEFTYGEILGDPSWYFTAPAIPSDHEICICFDFGS